LDIAFCASATAATLVADAVVTRVDSVGFAGGRRDVSIFDVGFMAMRHLDG
jgi:hypothetical protein